MDETTDYRSAKSDSLEGSGLARERWERFHDAIDDDVWVDICEVRGLNWATNVQEMPDEVKWEINDHVIEESELIGFWLAWHLAGGFSALERNGWHRATIHRKIRRFRSFFHKHPDDYRHPYLRLDLEKAWAARIKALLQPPEEP